MAELHSISLYREAHSASGDRNRAVSARHAPRQNEILAALPPEVYERLLPDLEFVPLPMGWTIHAATEEDKYVYFITAGIVSRLFVTESGASADYAIAGSEGAIGVGSFLGGKGSSSQAVVVSAGYAYRLRADLLKKEFERVGPLPLLLLRYTLALIAQAGQITACTRHHPLEQQLCRWILKCLDRLPSNELTMTQETMASMLGVRREGVTQAARNLQKAGLIHYRRGHIAVVDRHQLEAHACECYRVIKQEYDRLLHPEYTSGNAGGKGVLYRSVHAAESNPLLALCTEGI